MHPQAIKGLAHQRIFAKSRLTAEATAPLRPGELADGQREAIDNGKRGIMRHCAKQPLPQPFLEAPAVGGLTDEGGAMYVS